MKLSAPIFILKQHAKALSRKENIPLHKALDKIASREGFDAWGLLAAKVKSDSLEARLLQQLQPGDLFLIAARPGQGKTLLSLGLAIRAIQQGNPAAFFTLYATRSDVERWLGQIGHDGSGFVDKLLIDDSDAICADYIIARLASAQVGTLAIIDYLQLLDQSRQNPEVMLQVRKLKDFAKRRRVIVVFLSQIDRSYAASDKSCPSIDDVRLPNPLDLSLFDRTCFLNAGKVQLAPSA